MVHIWIAKEGSEAGQQNELMYGYLLQIINGALTSHTKSFMKDIVDSALSVLRERSYFTSISDVSIYKTKENLAFFAQGRRAKMVGGATTVQRLSLAPDEVVMEGKNVTFIQPGDFRPAVDVHFGPDGMIVVVDLPGMTRKDDNVEVVDNIDKKKNEVSLPKVDVVTDELVIKGHRLLYTPQVVQTEKVYQFPKLWDKRVYSYKKDSETYTVNVQRRGGEFEYRVKIPANNYNRQAPPKASLKFGVLYVFIPALKARK